MASLTPFSEDESEDDKDVDSELSSLTRKSEIYVQPDLLDTSLILKPEHIKSVRIHITSALSKCVGL